MLYGTIRIRHNRTSRFLQHKINNNTNKNHNWFAEQMLNIFSVENPSGVATVSVSTTDHSFHEWIHLQLNIYVSCLTCNDVPMLLY